MGYSLPQGRISHNDINSLCRVYKMPSNSHFHELVTHLASCENALFDRPGLVSELPPDCPRPRDSLREYLFLCDRSLEFLGLERSRDGAFPHLVGKGVHVVSSTGQTADALFYARDAKELISAGKLLQN